MTIESFLKFVSEWGPLALIVTGLVYTGSNILLAWQTAKANRLAAKVALFNAMLAELHRLHAIEAPDRFLEAQNTRFIYWRNELLKELKVNKLVPDSVWDQLR